MSTTKTKYVRKITTKSCGLAPETLEEIVKQFPQGVKVLRLYGFMKSCKSAPNQFGGEFQKYHGEHKAINLINGQEFRSDQIIFPPLSDVFMSDYFQSESSRLSAQNLDPITSPIQYGCDVGIVATGSSRGAKYCFTSDPLVESTGPDMLDLLGNQFGIPPLLSLPAPEEKLEEKPEAKPIASKSSKK